MVKENPDVKPDIENIFQKKRTSQIPQKCFSSQIIANSYNNQNY